MNTPPDFPDIPPNVKSTWNSAIAVSIVVAVVSVIGIVAIVYAIVRCLDKAGHSLPTHAQITIGNSENVANSTVYHVIPDSEIREATMEKFLNSMAREKPIRFSPDHLAAFTRNFSTELGRGGFGTVYKGQFPNGNQIAVKVLKNGSEKTVEQQFMVEISTIGRTYHNNIVRLFGFCFDTSLKALVYEYMENGSLDRLLFGNKNQEATEWEKLHEIAIGTAKGIAYLHEECEKMIIHYDIKPENVLLDANLNPKVADFGLATLCNRDMASQISRSRCGGTPGYAAPELYMPYRVTSRCDVYSFGMLLFEIVGRRRNSDGNITDTQRWFPRWVWLRFEKNELLEMLSFCGIEEKDREKAKRACLVAMWCVQYLPTARPSMSTVVKMLEGEMEIAPPPNPFDHLESDGPKILASGSDGSSHPSSWTTESQEQSFLEPMKRNHHTM